MWLLNHAHISVRRKAFRKAMLLGVAEHRGSLMLERTPGTEDLRAAPRLTLAQARSGVWVNDADMGVLLHWLETYLMKPHDELGRTGAVCPFTKQSAKIDAARVAISRAGADDLAEALGMMRAAFDELDKIPCKSGMEHFRTIIVGFPECSDERGLDMLKKVQKEMKWLSLSRFKMVGLMFAGSEAPGLWNHDFRPQRSPMPVLAIRHIVENDAFFAVRHPLLCAPYLLKYKFAGARKLWQVWRAKA